MNNDIVDLIEAALENKIYWSDHNSDDCISTGWRVLPFWVILYIRQGEYICIFDDNESDAVNADNIRVRAGAGEIMLIPASVKHQLVVEQPTVADGLHIQYTLFRNLDVLSFYEVPPVVTVGSAVNLVQSVDQLTATLKQFQQAPSINNIALKCSNAYRLFYDLLAVSRPVPDKEMRFLQLNRILPALKLIDTQLHCLVKVEELASACALSRNGFSRLFKQVIGTPPLRYITQKRLQCAMSKLVYSDAPIAVVAKELGFCDQFHFSKSFRSELGETPSQYRSNTRKTLQITL